MNSFSPKEIKLQQLIEEWNNTKAEYPTTQCIHQLFESQVERTPDKIALIFEEQQITYRELNRRANQLAHYLQTLQVGPDVLVGICMERSLLLAIGLLGILKAGGAYVPLDPAYPQERLAFMIEDSQLSVLLTEFSPLNTKLRSNIVVGTDGETGGRGDGEIRNVLRMNATCYKKEGWGGSQDEKTDPRLPHLQARVVCLDSDWENIIQHSEENLDIEVTPDNLAYTIYTSGSTGKPKGVQVLHRGVVNFLTSMSLAPGLTEQDILLAVTTISFDIAALELYLPLTVGAQITLVRREVAANAAQLIEALEQSGATVMQATPATWRLLLAANWKGSATLKILCGGEAMSRDLANQLLERSAALWNMYGPTETTIWSAIHQVEPGNTAIPIGRPIANTQIYLVDPEINWESDPIQLVPVGEPGELLIGGVGLARGYLNRPELTEKRFIQDPFSTEQGARLYRTGDLARYLPDGTIEYIGRIDHQVKIRGFRIELGEIEAALYQHSSIREAVVVAREDVPGDQRLVAYMVTDLNVERIPLQTSCLVEWEGNQARRLTTVDLSFSGICLTNVPADWKEGMNLTLSLQLPGIQDELGLQGTLAWRHHNRAGILFQTTPNQDALLRQSIKHITQTEGVEVSDLRRVEPRVPLESTATVELESGRTLEVTTVNLARGGICLLANAAHNWKEGEHLRLRLQLPEIKEELWLRGTVVWQFRKYAGIAFGSTPQEQEQIRQTVDYIIETQGLSLTHLRSFLKNKLPDYMVPSTFVILDALPITPNCKVDRQALPAPKPTRELLAETFVAPQNPIEEQLVQIWAKVLGIEKVGVNDNFFELGGHSLLTAQLLSQVRETLQVELPLATLFESPTVAELTQAITITQDSNSTSRVDSLRCQTLQADAVLEPTIYPDVPFVSSKTEPQRIFLTGASGFLGAFLLHELLQQTQATIYCLVRSSSLEEAKQKLHRNLKRYLLANETLDNRIIPVLGDLSGPGLGLSLAQFEELAAEIDVIYHNGAFVNLIYPYTALRKANVLGTKEILKLASKIKVKPVHFISTLDVFQAPDYSKKQVILETDDLTGGQGLCDGYSQSKWVAEKLIKAAHSRGIPTCIYRPGMITGHSTTGASHTNDLICRLFKGLTQLGYAPDLDLNLSLTPVDYVSKAIVHLSQQPASLGQAFHLVSPDAVPLREILHQLQAIGYSIKSTDYHEWQTQLLKIASSQVENALSPLLFLFTEWRAGNQLSYLETAALVSQAFDCQNTLAGLAGTDIVCPQIDSRLLRAYFSYIGIKDLRKHRLAKSLNSR